MKVGLTILVLLWSLESFAQHAERKGVCKVLPEHAQAQFAGGVGFVSAGVGYGLFNNNLRASLLYGYVPKRYTGSTAVHQVTLKSTLRLVRFHPSGKLLVSPYIGATASLEPNGHAILVLPDRYPRRYYGTMAFHFTGLGGVSAAVPVNAGFVKGLELYGELVAMDTMLGYRWQNENVGLNRILSAAFGVVATF